MCIQSISNVALPNSQMKTTYLLSIVVQKLFKMCARVLAPLPQSCTHTKTCYKFKLGLQFVTKQNEFYLLGKATFGTLYILHIVTPIPCMKYNKIKINANGPVLKHVNPVNRRTIYTE
jgi:hypothetical protein